MAKKTTNTTSDVIVELYGFKIKKNTLYEVREKLDTSAPDGFKEHRTSKVLSEPITDIYPGAAFDKTRGIWDTGLFMTSTALQKAIPNAEVRELALKSLQENIIDPWEAEKGEDTLSNKPTNNYFWDRFKVGFSKGKVFDTGKLDDLLQLYLSLVHQRLTPKEYESHPDFKQPKSLYLIVDKESSMNRKAEQAMTKGKSQALFYNLLSMDKEGLVSILDYLGISAKSTTEDSVLYTIFEDYIESKEDKFQNVKLFLEAAEKYKTDEGKEIFYIHKTLKELYTKGKVKFKKGEVYLDDVYVENGWKNSADKIHKDKELHELLIKMVE